MKQQTKKFILSTLTEDHNLIKATTIFLNHQMGLSPELRLSTEESGDDIKERLLLLERQSRQYYEAIDEIEKIQTTD